MASLATYHPKNLVEVENDLVASFEELNVNTEMTIRQKIYHAMRHYLRLTAQGLLDEYDGCAKAVDIECTHYPPTKLFERPDCDAYFKERATKYKFPGHEYSGQYFGIEKLVELHHRSYDYFKWTKELDEQCRSEINKEAVALLNTYYKDEYYDQTNIPK